MAIVKTTNKQTNTSGSTPNGTNGNTPETKPVDRTKSVVNQGGAPVVRRPAPAVRAGQRGGVQTAPAARGSFVKETIAELQKVVWPTREQVQSGTIVTIGLLIVFGLYISGLDYVVETVFTSLGLFPK